MKDVSEAAENGTVMEGDVMEANKGGVVVNVKGVRVFVPRSQATMRRDEDYTKLVGQHVKLVITECAGRKIVGRNNIKHPSEVVSVGDTIEVYVKSYDPENQKVSLGYKKEEDNPWEKLKNEYPIGSEFEAPVVSITKFGAFVRILPGIDGLVHISEISNERVNKVSDVLKVGDMVKVKLINVDFDRKRISLSMKACLDEAAEDAE